MPTVCMSSNGSFMPECNRGTTREHDPSEENYYPGNNDHSAVNRPTPKPVVPSEPLSEDERLFFEATSNGCSYVDGTVSNVACAPAEPEPESYSSPNEARSAYRSENFDYGDFCLNVVTPRIFVLKRLDFNLIGSTNFTGSGADIVKEFVKDASFHRNAVILSVAESVGDAASGVAKQAIYVAPDSAKGLYELAGEELGTAGKVMGVALAPFAWLKSFMFDPIGDSIGTGLGVLVNHKNESMENIALGAAGLFGGLCGAASLVLGAIVPKPSMSVPEAVKGVKIFAKENIAKVKNTVTSKPKPAMISEPVMDPPPPFARPWEPGGEVYMNYWQERLANIERDIDLSINELRANPTREGELAFARSTLKNLGDLSAMRRDPGFAIHDLPWTEGFFGKIKGLELTLKSELWIIDNFNF